MDVMKSAQATVAMLESAEPATYLYSSLWPDSFLENSVDGALRFLYEVRTWNEAERACQHFPRKRYIEQIVAEWFDCRERGDPLIIEKVRRMVTSWLLRGLNCWNMGLGRSNGVITHFTNEDAANHVWRIWHLYNDLRLTHPHWGLAAPKTYGAIADQQLDSLILPNGSKVEKHFENPAGLQGSGYSWVDCEEISMYKRPSAMVAQAQFVTKASAKAVNGLITLVTNSSADEDWQKVKGNEVAIPHGLHVKRLDSGATYLTLHYTADEEKDEVWAAAEKKSFIGTDRDWDVQMELKELVTDGVPVYSGFVEKLHAPDWLREEDVPLVAYAKYFGGWDIGNTLHPAFVLLQCTTSAPKMTQIVCEVVGEPGTSMTDFAPAVIRVLRARFPGILLTDIVHGADESGQSKNGVTGQSAFDVAIEHGIALNPISNNLFSRLPAVDKLLAGRLDPETASFFYSVRQCPWIHKGFQGGYKLKRITTGKEGAVADTPAKDEFSHPHDALQYAAVAAESYWDADKPPQRHTRGSGASRSRRRR